MRVVRATRRVVVARDAERQRERGEQAGGGEGDRAATVRSRLGGEDRRHGATIPVRLGICSREMSNDGGPEPASPPTLSEPAPSVPSEPPAPPAPPAVPAVTQRRRDLRRWIYGVLDLVFAAVYAIAIWKVIPNRLPSAAVHLWSIPAATLALAVGTLLGGRRGWRVAVIAGSVVLAATFLLIVRIVVSAAFLAGVYGAFGKAAASFSLLAVAIVIEAVVLLPIVQVKFLMSRAGRRAYGAPKTGFRD